MAAPLGALHFPCDLMGHPGGRPLDHVLARKVTRIFVLQNAFGSENSRLLKR